MTCYICHERPISGKTLTCSLAACRKEFRRWAKLLPVTQRDLLDAAMCYAALRIACDEAGGSPPLELHLKAIKAVEMAAVAYTMTAAKLGKLPKPDAKDEPDEPEHPAMVCSYDEVD